MNEPEPDLTDLVDDELAVEQWDAWLEEHPDAAGELDVARRVRALMLELQDARISVPADFQLRLMQRIREDTAVQHLVDLALSGLGQALLELLAALFSVLPAAQPEPAS